MTKTSHRVRVWAYREGVRTLEFSDDAPESRSVALQRVTALRADARVHEIEMREHLALPGDNGEIAARRRSMHWLRTDGQWRRLPDSNPKHRPRAIIATP